jgi:hypothetical protein
MRFIFPVYVAFLLYTAFLIAENISDAEIRNNITRSDRILCGFSRRSKTRCISGTCRGCWQDQFAADAAAYSGGGRTIRQSRR